MPAPCDWISAALKSSNVRLTGVAENVRECRFYDSAERLSRSSAKIAGRLSRMAVPSVTPMASAGGTPQADKTSRSQRLDATRLMTPEDLRPNARLSNLVVETGRLSPDAAARSFRERQPAFQSSETRS